MPITFKLQTDSADPLSKQLTRQIELAIARGDLSPGEPLTSVRQLARELQINPNTISKAFAVLVQACSLASQPGKGYFVAHTETRFSENEIERQIKNAAESFVVATRPLGVSRQRLLKALEDLLPEDSSRG